VHVLFRADLQAECTGACDFVSSYRRVHAAFPAVHFVREVDFAAQVVFHLYMCCEVRVSVRAGMFGHEHASSSVPCCKFCVFYGHFRA
jgi:hypothetical protein